ncbi:unnamed protein product, partial [Phytomonas sp. EM1]
MGTVESNKFLDAIVLCGPSGVGKGTLLNRLLSDYKDRFAFSISHTTRGIREGEVDGRHYHFVPVEVMKEMERRGEFLEMCEVHGNFYGTSIAAVQAARKDGKVCIIEIDVKGAMKLHAREQDGSITARYLFLTAPMEVLRDRLLLRGTESEALRQRRLETAKFELDFLEANPDLFSAVVVNDDLNMAYTRLVQSINAIFSQFRIAPLDPEKMELDNW